MTPDTPDWRFYELHFDPLRMNEYLVEVGGDEAAAKSLFAWNVNISVAFWELMGFIEVAVRNLICRTLRKRQLRLGLDPNWALAFDRKLFGINSKMTSALDEAHRRLRQSGSEANQSNVVSELGFGFWCQWLTKQYLFLWPDFQRGFKGLASHNQNDVGRLMNDVRDLRNRVAHHHKIWHLNLERKHENLLRLATYIDPDFGVWLAGKSRVADLLALRPQRVSA